MSIKDSMAKSTSQGNKRQVSEATMHYPSELCEGPRSASQFVRGACNFQYSLVLTSWFLFAATVMGHSWFDSLWPSSSSSFIINFHCRIYFLLLGFYIHLLSSLWLWCWHEAQLHCWVLTPSSLPTYRGVHSAIIVEEDERLMSWVGRSVNEIFPSNLKTQKEAHNIPFYWQILTQGSQKIFIFSPK